MTPGEGLDAEESAGESHRDHTQIRGATEALLLMAEEPLSATTLAGAVQVPLPTMSAILAELQHFYDQTDRGFELRHVGGGWRYWTRAEHAEVIAAHVLDGQQARLSQAALETLAVIAYQQPISRSRVSAIRGVNVDGVMRTLVGRSMIEETGQDEQSGAVLFGTTAEFLERMGLHTLDELPPLAPHLPDVGELEAELGQLAQAAEPTGAVTPEGEGSQQAAQERGHVSDRGAAASERTHDE